MRRMALLASCILFIAILVAPTAKAEEIEVVAASLRATEQGLILDADFAFELSPRLVDVVTNGVPLYFKVDFELTRPRWYWFDETTATSQLLLRLSYHALSRQYRVSAGLLQQDFTTLEEALNVLKRVRRWLVVDRTVPLGGEDYVAAVRMRHDTSLLPKPFQITALTAREFHLESPWRRFSVRSLRQAPAPVESRDPRGFTSR